MLHFDIVVPFSKKNAHISHMGAVPQVVSAAKDEVGPGVECGAQPAQAAVTAGTLQTVLMPVSV